MSSPLELHLGIIKYVPLFFAAAIFVFTAIGWYLGNYRLRKNNGSEIAVRDSLAAAIFGLSALVLGFTFSTAATRYNVRVDSVRAQAQILGEVYKSIKYLAPSDQVVIKNSLNDLLNLRLTIYKDSKSRLDVDKGAEKISEASRRIYEEASRATRNAPAENQALVNEILMPQVRSLSTVFAAGIINMQSHPPRLLMNFLFSLLCVGAFLIGYTMAVKSESDWLLAGLYIVLIGLSLYVILSLELPHLLMNDEEINREFLLLKDSVNPAP
jgi:hypothetical protein